MAEIDNTRSTAHCDKGWNDPKFNAGGDCCCNCRLRLQINGHPWRNGESISTPTGQYVCYAFGRMDNSRDCNLSNEHGMCECHSRMSKDQEAQEERSTITLRMKQSEKLIKETIKNKIKEGNDD